MKSDLQILQDCSELIWNTYIKIDKNPLECAFILGCIANALELIIEKMIEKKEDENG
jgi:hypothetical protein